LVYVKNAFEQKLSSFFFQPVENLSFFDYCISFVKRLFPMRKESGVGYSNEDFSRVYVEFSDVLARLRLLVESAL
jgi:hypothetical protein